MIKIFNSNDRDFSTAGNIIINPIKCKEFKKKSLNGWYIDVEIPIKYKEHIEKDKLCVIKTKSKLKPQAFRIGEDISYTSRKISFRAKHVMFDSEDYFLLDVRPTNLNGINSLDYINERTDIVSPFKIYSNVENINTAYFIRRSLLEAWATIEERWDGVFDADNWDISFLQKVGNDNGESIIYGKNLEHIEVFEDWSNVVTKLYPVGYDGIMLPEVFLENDIKYEKPYTRRIDFQTELESEKQTEENLIVELRKNAIDYLEENKYPKISYTVKSDINQTLEIGDTVHVLHPIAEILTEVLEYEYDVISERVKSITFGNFKRDIKTKFDNIKNTIEQVSQSVSKQTSVINEQTKLINSLNKNGKLYIDDNELLILDNLPKENAQNVWRLGLGGFGFSSSGYEGPFETAITMDGKINAKFITTGVMSVDRIEGLANKISEYDTQLTEIELNANNITQRVESNSVDIHNNYQQIIKKFDEVAKNDDLVTIQNKVETIQSNTDFVINVVEDLQTNGVSKVKTETGFTLNNNGLNIEKTNAKTKSTLNEKGLAVKDNTGSSEENLLFAGYDEETGETIVKSKNMTVEKYLTIGTHSRIEDYENGTGMFWIGG